MPWVEFRPTAEGARALVDGKTDRRAIYGKDRTDNGDDNDDDDVALFLTDTVNP